jgi:hypothetical protein
MWNNATRHFAVAAFVFKQHSKQQTFEYKNTKTTTQLTIWQDQWERHEQSSILALSWTIEVTVTVIVRVYKIVLHLIVHLDTVFFGD